MTTDEKAEEGGFFVDEAISNNVQIIEKGFLEKCKEEAKLVSDDPFVLVNNPNIKQVRQNVSAVEEDSLDFEIDLSGLDSLSKDLQKGTITAHFAKVEEVEEINPKRHKKALSGNKQGEYGLEGVLGDLEGAVGEFMEQLEDLSALKKENSLSRFNQFALSIPEGMEEHEKEVEMEMHEEERRQRRQKEAEEFESLEKQERELSEKWSSENPLFATREQGGEVRDTSFLQDMIEESESDNSDKNGPQTMSDNKADEKSENQQDWEQLDDIVLPQAPKSSITSTSKPTSLNSEKKNPTDLLQLLGGLLEMKAGGKMAFTKGGVEPEASPPASVDRSCAFDDDKPWIHEIQVQHSSDFAEESPPAEDEPIIFDAEKIRLEILIFLCMLISLFFLDQQTLWSTLVCERYHSRTLLWRGFFLIWRHKIYGRA